MPNIRYLNSLNINHKIIIIDEIHNIKKSLESSKQTRYVANILLKVLELATNVKLVLMSATPIPRTMMMSNYGDMDISKITEKPAHRKKIITIKKKKN